jgi:hypothetical protein
MRRAALLLALAACSVAPDPRRDPADVGRAAEAERFGDLAQAERALAPLFLDDVPRARRGEVFWAGWFLATAHARAAFEPPRDVGLGGGGARAAHAQAALYYARRARTCLDAAPDLPPAGLEYPGNRDQAALALDLLELALEAQLGFDERVARMVEANAELTRLGGEARLAEAAHLDPRQSARLDLALWGHWAQRDEARALELAADTLVAADAHDGLLGQVEIARLEDWIRQGGRFRCPECRQAAVPELRACPNDQTPLARHQREP